MEKCLLEIVPPSATWNQEKKESYVKEIASVLKKEKILSVTVPEIVDEVKRGKPCIDKMDSLEFGSLLKTAFPELVVIQDKVTVLLAKDQFRDWLEKAYASGLRHLVLVGGEKDEIEYSGYSVCEAAAFIKERYPKIKLGGITIFERDLEEERIQTKMDAGIDFFVSQIIFETKDLEAILVKLAKIPPIYISLALPSNDEDIQLLKNLGVKISASIEEQLINNLNGPSIVLNQLLDDLFTFMQVQKIDLNFNVEHLTYHNLDPSYTLFQTVRDRIARS